MDTQEIISRLGGTAKAAILCDITPSAVSQWLKTGIPKARLMFLKLARPDIFVTPPGRHPPSPTNILDTIPTHSVVLPAIPPSLDPKEKP